MGWLQAHVQVHDLETDAESADDLPQTLGSVTVAGLRALFPGR